MTSLTPIHDGIIFQFIDKINNKGQFERTNTETGIMLSSNFDESAKSPRWVDVLAVGHECTIEVGVQALVPNLRWTAGVKHEGSTFWKTDEQQVVATRKTPNSPIEPMEDVVIFECGDSRNQRSTSGLIIVADSSETPRGKVISIGSKCDKALLGSTIFYDDTNFSDVFEHQAHRLAFIKEDKILAYTPV